MWLSSAFVCLHVGPIFGHQLPWAPDPISPDTTVDESFLLQFAFVLNLLPYTGPSRQRPSRSPWQGTFIFDFIFIFDIILALALEGRGSIDCILESSEAVEILVLWERGRDARNWRLHQKRGNGAQFRWLSNFGGGPGPRRRYIPKNPVSRGVEITRCIYASLCANGSWFGCS